MATLVILGTEETGKGHVSLADTRQQFLLARGGEVRLSQERSIKDIAPALLRVRRHWVVLPHPASDPLAVNGVPVVSFKVLDHGDILQVDGLRLRLSELRGETLASDAPLVLQEKACPVCSTGPISAGSQKSFRTGERVLYCPVCGLGHHDGCFRYNRKCASWPFCGYVLPLEELEDRKEGRA